MTQKTKRAYLRAGRAINGGLPMDQQPCLRFLVPAPVIDYKPSRLAEIRVPGEAVESSGPVVVYWRDGRRV